VKISRLEEKIENFQVEQKIEQEEIENDIETFPDYKDHFRDISKSTSVYLNCFLYEKFLLILNKKQLKKYSVLNQLIFNFIIENEKEN
jgi:hypothetical protein